MVPSTTLHNEAMQFLQRIDSEWLHAVTTIGPYTPNPRPICEPYQALIEAIVYQQITTKAGDAILARFKELFAGGPFPEAQQLLEMNPDTIRGCGFSNAKTATVKAIAEATLNGTIPSRNFAISMSDSELIDQITTIKGIGRWTVEIVLIHSLKRQDVLPADDLGIREGYRFLKSLEQAPTPREMREISLSWAPYRTAAAWYLWKMPRLPKYRPGTASIKTPTRQEPAPAIVGKRSQRK